jgi:hypothetical protein
MREKQVLNIKPEQGYLCERCSNWEQYSSNPTWGKCTVENVPRYMHETYHTYGCNYHSLYNIGLKPAAKQLFEDSQIRMEYDEEKGEWLLSIVDVVEVLMGTSNPRRYWSDLKRKLKSEDSQLYENIVQLKLQSSDGKKYNTDVANTKWLLRIIQFISSPKAESFRTWLSV